MHNFILMCIRKILGAFSLLDAITTSSLVGGITPSLFQFNSAQTTEVKVVH